MTRFIWFGGLFLLFCFFSLKAQEIEDFSQCTIEELIGFLSSNNVDLLLDTIYEIGNRGEKAVATGPSLIRLLRHPDEWICLGVADTLVKLGPEVLSLFPEALQVKSAKARSYACRSLGSFLSAGEKVLPLLERALTHPEAEVQISAMHSFWQFQEQAKPYLSKILPFAQSANMEVQKEAILALSEIDPNQKEVIEILLSLLGAEDEGLRLILGESIAKVVPTPKEHLQLFLKILPQIENDYIRSKVVEAIGNAAQPEGVKEVVSYLEDPSSYVRYQSLKAIQKGNTFPKEEINRFLFLFQDSYEPVRILAPTVAAELQLIETVPSLLSLLRDINPRVRLQAVKALGVLSPASEKQVRGLLSALQDVQMNIVQEAVVSLGNLKKESLPVVHTLIRFASVAKGEMLITLLRALAQIKPESEKVVPTLQKILEQASDPIIKIWCYHLWYAVDPASRKDATNELLHFFESTEPNVSFIAFEAIALLDEPSPELLDALVSQYPTLHKTQQEFLYQRFQKLNMMHRLEKFCVEEKDK